MMNEKNKSMELNVFGVVFVYRADLNLLGQEMRAISYLIGALGLNFRDTVSTLNAAAAIDSGGIYNPFRCTIDSDDNHP
jgi:hypothetical protein